MKKILLALMFNIAEFKKVISIAIVEVVNAYAMHLHCECITNALHHKKVCIAQMNFVQCGCNANKIK